MEFVRTEPDWLTRLGGWLFRHRTALPLPFAAAILTLPTGETPRSAALVVAGVLITALGETLRLWGVLHIGAISRTRSERLGPLVATGPFSRIRNPLYVGNILLWVGFALTARLVWVAVAVALLLALEYHAIVRWEERLLDTRLGEAYREYASRVPRWIPRRNRRGRGATTLSASPALSAVPSGSFSWRETLFSERGTLVAVAAGYLLLWIKARF